TDILPYEESPVLHQPSEAEDIVADYASMRLTLGRHPMALLRAHLKRHRYLSAADLRALPDKQLARCAGLVTGRQRPGTATGVIFVTLEDETGMTNVIVHADLVERQRKELLGAQLLGVRGIVQHASDGEVVHVLAQFLEDHSTLLDTLGGLSLDSRDFH
ncbi:MAG TPA: OB-fold nucleic acid binding domain-containing protein, partial [Rhodocyclaceae bacterium]|nr:OB-fold nucleic acid binding domain-containing protein [Rhodocyclaceae bacterium]